MKHALIVPIGFLLLFAGLNRLNVKQASAQASSQAGAKPSLVEARRGFKTKLLRQVAQNKPVPAPPNDSGPAANITFTKEELASLKAR